jgi:V8-like Glu-specific endopeptidase
MATNKPKGDNARKGAVKDRSQTLNPKTGNWTKRDSDSGKFIDVKQDKKPFKGVRKED